MGSPSLAPLALRLIDMIHPSKYSISATLIALSLFLYTISDTPKLKQFRTYPAEGPSRDFSGAIHFSRFNIRNVENKARLLVYS